MTGKSKLNHQLSLKLENENNYYNLKMKLSTALIASVAAIDVKTLVNQNEDDKKVPHRHPLQRLWRLYQFSEEFIMVRITLFDWSVCRFWQKPCFENKNLPIKDIIKIETNLFIRLTLKVLWDLNNSKDWDPALANGCTRLKDNPFLEVNISIYNPVSNKVHLCRYQAMWILQRWTWARWSKRFKRPSKPSRGYS